MGRICINYSIYIHIPFCTSRCAYCDFVTYAGRLHLLDDYVKALQTEMRIVAANAPQRLSVQTVYFGGGTPSLLETEHIDSILATVQDLFDLQVGAEISIEANPGTIDTEKLTGWRKSGVNRLSLGVQAGQDGILKRLGRIHSVDDVRKSVLAAKKAGYDNIGLDLIYGIPFQTLPEWIESLRLALALDVQHLSLYALTLEDHTPLQEAVASGRLPEPDTDLAADMYEAAEEILQAGGFASYEISNWHRQNDGEKRSYRCEHNLQYWRNLPYFGYGAGAHGFISNVRTANVTRIEDYLQRIRNKSQVQFPASPANEHLTILNEKDEIGETMMMGLRLTSEGVGEASFFSRFHRSLGDTFGNEIKRLTSLALLEWIDDEEEGRRLRLTKKGRLLGNQVFIHFV